MCNDFGNRIPYDEYLRAFSQIRVLVHFPEAAPNIEPRDDIWPTDPAPVIRRLEDGTNDFAQLRWFTGTKSPKTKWRFTRAGEDWFCFAGLWRPLPDRSSGAFTILTTAPGPDVAPIPDRQMVVLDRADWLAWLDVTRPEAELLKSLPADSLVVEQVR